MVGATGGIAFGAGAVLTGVGTVVIGGVTTTGPGTATGSALQWGQACSHTVHFVLKCPKHDSGWINPGPDWQ